MPSQPAQTLWIGRQGRPSRAAPGGALEPPATGLGSTCPAPTAARFGGAELAAAAGERVLCRAGRQSRIFGGRMSRLRGALRRRQAAASGRARGCRGPGSTHAAGTVPHLGRGAGWAAGTARYGAPELPAGCEDDSASMASALLLFAYRRSALLWSRPLALSGGGGDTLPEIPAPAPQMQRQDCPRRPSSSP